MAQLVSADLSGRLSRVHALKEGPRDIALHVTRRTVMSRKSKGVIAADQALSRGGTNWANEGNIGHKRKVATSSTAIITFSEYTIPT